MARSVRNGDGKERFWRSIASVDDSSRPISSNTAMSRSRQAFSNDKEDVLGDQWQTLHSMDLSPFGRRRLQASNGALSRVEVLFAVSEEVLEL